MVFPIVGGDGKPTGYEVENSLRMYGVDNYGTITQGTATNEKKFTFSSWVKLGSTGHSANGTLFGSGDDGNGYVGDALMIQTNGLIKQGDHDGSTDNHNVRTNAVLRDITGWYHIVCAADSTQGTASNRIKLYINGTQQTSLAVTTYPSQDITFDCNTNGQVLNIGRNQNGENNVYFSGYLAETVFIDGQQLTPSSFGETDNNGVWIPKDISAEGLTFGNNGFYLEYKQTGTSANASGIYADTSGNGNHLQPNNHSAIHVGQDTPTNNFATLNPLNIRQGIGTTFQEANTKVLTATSGSSTAGAFSTIAGLKSGKWYAEFRPDVVGTNATMRFGIEDTDFNAADGLCNVAASAYASNGNKGRNATDTSYGDSYDVDDIIGVDVDLDNGAIYFSKNGTWQNSGDPESGSSKTGAAYTDILTILPDGGYMFAFNLVYNNSQQEIVEANFGFPGFSISSANADGNGYGVFEYAVPSGYYALCTKNLAEFG